MKLLQIETVKRRPLITPSTMAEYSIAITLLCVAALALMAVGQMMAWIVGGL